MVSRKKALVVRKNVSKVAKKNKPSSYRHGRKSVLRKRKNKNMSVKNRRRLNTKKNRRMRKIRSKRLKYNMEGGSQKTDLITAFNSIHFTNISSQLYKYFVSALYKTYTAVNFKSTTLLNLLGSARLWENGMFLPKVKLGKGTTDKEIKSWHPFIVLGENCQRGIGPKLSLYRSTIYSLRYKFEGSYWYRGCTSGQYTSISRPNTRYFIQGMNYRRDAIAYSEDFSLEKFCSPMRKEFFFDNSQGEKMEDAKKKKPNKFLSLGALTNYNGENLCLISQHRTISRAFYKSFHHHSFVPKEYTGFDITYKGSKKVDPKELKKHLDQGKNNLHLSFSDLFYNRKADLSISEAFKSTPTFEFNEFVKIIKYLIDRCLTDKRDNEYKNSPSHPNFNSEIIVLNDVTSINLGSKTILNIILYDRYLGTNKPPEYETYLKDIPEYNQFKYNLIFKKYINLFTLPNTPRNKFLFFIYNAFTIPSVKDLLIDLIIEENQTTPKDLEHFKKLSPEEKALLVFWSVGIHMSLSKAPNSTAPNSRKIISYNLFDGTEITPQLVKDCTIPEIKKILQEIYKILEPLIEKLSEKDRQPVLPAHGHANASQPRAHVMPARDPPNIHYAHVIHANGQPGRPQGLMNAASPIQPRQSLANATRGGIGPNNTHQNLRQTGKTSEEISDKLNAEFGLTNQNQQTKTFSSSKNLFKDVLDYINTLIEKSISITEIFESRSKKILLTNRKYPIKSNSSRFLIVSIDDLEIFSVGQHSTSIMSVESYNSSTDGKTIMSLKLNMIQIGAGPFLIKTYFSIKEKLEPFTQTYLTKKKKVLMQTLKIPMPLFIVDSAGRSDGRNYKTLAQKINVRIPILPKSETEKTYHLKKLLNRASLNDEKIKCKIYSIGVIGYFIFNFYDDTNIPSNGIILHAISPDGLITYISEAIKYEDLKKGFIECNKVKFIKDDDPRRKFKLFAEIETQATKLGYDIDDFFIKCVYDLQTSDNLSVSNPIIINLADIDYYYFNTLTQASIQTLKRNEFTFYRIYGFNSSLRYLIKYTIKQPTDFNTFETGISFKIFDTQEDIDLFEINDQFTPLCILNFPHNILMEFINTYSFYEQLFGDNKETCNINTIISDNTYVGKFFKTIFPTKYYLHTDSKPDDENKRNVIYEGILETTIVTTKDIELDYNNYEKITISIQFGKKSVRIIDIQNILDPEELKTINSNPKPMFMIKKESEGPDAGTYHIIQFSKELLNSNIKIEVTSLQAKPSITNFEKKQQICTYNDGKLQYEINQTERVLIYPVTRMTSDSPSAGVITLDSRIQETDKLRGELIEKAIIDINNPGQILELTNLQISEAYINPDNEDADEFAGFATNDAAAAERDDDDDDDDDEEDDDAAAFQVLQEGQSQDTGKIINCTFSGEVLPPWITDGLSRRSIFLKIKYIQQPKTESISLGI